LRDPSARSNVNPRSRASQAAKKFIRDQPISIPEYGSTAARLISGHTVPLRAVLGVLAAGASSNNRLRGELQAGWDWQVCYTGAVGPRLVAGRRSGANGMDNTVLQRKLFAALAALLLAVTSACMVPHPAIIHEGTSPETARIINHYLQVVETHEDALRGASMEVDITGSIPKLKEHASLRALRTISKIGVIGYHVLSFQGSNTVKNQVIARYLQAERQGQADQALAIVPANYKFKFKAETTAANNERVYVFNLSPRKKRVGLFKGQMWLDARTYLPVFEKGRFVKNPSIFFKKVDFERAYKIENGVAVPEYMNSVIDARLIGKVELNISYSKFEPNAAGESGTGAIMDGAAPAAAAADPVSR
jgi:hypothetical protein